MSFSPVAASKNIYDKYRRYLKTIFMIDDELYNRQFLQQLEDRKSLAAGPYLDVSDSFVKGKSIEELIDEGIIAKGFRRICFPLTRPLFKHQEISLRKVQAGENLIVSTGTGSGKTECFLIPVLNELIREQEAGTLDKGVRALLIYPMNALANDQVERLRELLADYPEITFGSYTGQTPEKYEEALIDYKRLNENKPPLKNELISRTQIRETPPNILITNYAMLEYLMVRPGDSIFFAEEYADKWKFIVLDEAHVYNGSSGIEVSMLLRRLKATLRNDKTQYILTSATLGDPGSDGDVAAFGRNLCDSEFTKENIIRAYRITPKPERTTVTVPMTFYADVARILDNDDDIQSATPLCRQYSSLPSSCKVEEMLYDILLNDTNYNRIKEALAKPMTVLEIAALMNWNENELADFVTVATKAERNGDRLFDARYHMFLRATDSVFITLRPNGKLFLNRKQKHREPDGSEWHVFEIATCSVCHAIYIIGRRNDAGYLMQTSLQSTFDSPEIYLLRSKVSDMDEDHPLTEENIKADELEICARCGHVHRVGKIECGHESACQVKVNKVTVKTEQRTLTKCLACENTNGFGILRRFFGGQEAVTSVLGTALFEELPSYRKEKKEIVVGDDDDGFGPAETVLTSSQVQEAKQFIAFSDNRQAAAFMQVIWTSRTGIFCING